MPYLGSGELSRSVRRARQRDRDLPGVRHRRRADDARPGQRRDLEALLGGGRPARGRRRSRASPATRSAAPSATRSSSIIAASCCAPSRARTGWTLLAEARVPAGPIHRLDELAQDPALHESGFIYRTEGPDGADPAGGPGHPLRRPHRRHRHAAAQARRAHRAHPAHVARLRRRRKSSNFAHSASSERNTPCSSKKSPTAKTARSARITLNRPDDGNMFTPQMCHEIRDCINEIRRETRTRVHRHHRRRRQVLLHRRPQGRHGGHAAVRRRAAHAGDVREHRPAAEAGDRLGQRLRRRRRQRAAGGVRHHDRQGKRGVPPGRPDDGQLRRRLRHLVPGRPGRQEAREGDVVSQPEAHARARRWRWG